MPEQVANDEGACRTDERAPRVDRRGRVSYLR